jgi:hypothetical protein
MLSHFCDKLKFYMTFLKDLVADLTNLVSIFCILNHDGLVKTQTCTDGLLTKVCYTRRSGVDQAVAYTWYAEHRAISQQRSDRTVYDAINDRGGRRQTSRVISGEIVKVPAAAAFAQLQTGIIPVPPLNGCHHSPPPSR